LLTCVSGEETGLRDVVNVQGAGTSNPSRFFWDVMGTLESQTKIPVNLGYRAVGSSTGYKEFVGIDLGSNPYPNDMPYVAKNDFGSGDIPIPTNYYDALQQNGNRTIMQLPFVAGAIAIFYNNNDGAVPNLQLEPCTLAKIFSGAITNWNDADIQSLNVGTTLPDLSITVVHRQLGSSSTAGLTGYLVKTTQEYGCTGDWTLGTGSTITWPVSFEGRQGSGGVTEMIAATPGAIGYLDSGHGYEAGFAEIALRNENGIFIRAVDANIGIATEEAINAGVIPTDPTDSWAEVTGYNLPGDDTWPITMLSYFYLNQDWTYMGGEQAGLLMYFVRYVLSTAGQTLAADTFGFAPMPQSLIDFDLTALDSIQLPADFQEWTEESQTQIIQGAGDYVISAKRKTASSIALDGLTSELDTLGVDTLAEEFVRLEAEYDAAKLRITDLERAINGEVDESFQGVLDRIDLLENSVSAANADTPLLLLAGMSTIWLALRV